MSSRTLNFITLDYLNNTIKRFYGYSRSTVFVLFGLSILRGLNGPLALYFTSLIISRFVVTKLSGYNLVLLIFFEFSLLILFFLTQNLFEYRVSELSRNVDAIFKIPFLQLISKLHLNNIETNQNIIQRASFETSQNNLNIFKGVLNISSNLTAILAYLLIVYNYFPKFSLIIFVSFLAYVIIVSFLLAVKPKNALENKDFTVKAYLESLFLYPNAFKYIKSFDAYKWIVGRIGQTSIEFKLFEDEQARVDVKGLLYSDIILTMIHSLILVVVYVQLLGSRFSVPDFFLILIAVRSIRGFTSSILSDVKSIKENVFALDDLNIDNITSNKTNFVAIKAEDTPYAFVFKDVSYSYGSDDRKAIDLINVSVEKGKKVMIVGRNGSGKSTFIKLLSGQYDNYLGSIEILGFEVKSLQNLNLSRILTIAYQDQIIIEDTLLNNLLLGQDGSVERLKRIEKYSAILNFTSTIDKLPNGINSPIGFSGESPIMLSGGELQKLSIIRALSCDSDMIIFDEPTSNLDKTSQEAFYSELSADLRSSVVVTHDTSRGDLFDYIMVLENGKLCEFGSHYDLLSRKSAYKDLYFKNLGVASD